MEFKSNAFSARELGGYHFRGLPDVIASGEKPSFPLSRPKFPSSKSLEDFPTFAFLKWKRLPAVSPSNISKFCEAGSSCV